jgi:hypothetical protein
VRYAEEMLMILMKMGHFANLLSSYAINQYKVLNLLSNRPRGGEVNSTWQEVMDKQRARM